MAKNGIFDRLKARQWSTHPDRRKVEAEVAAINLTRDEANIPVVTGQKYKAWLPRIRFNQQAHFIMAVSKSTELGEHHKRSDQKTPASY
ncbi:hypothetical protein WAI453_001745 [Rhynchosporium graminicola]